MPRVPTRARRQSDAISAIAASSGVDVIVAAAHNRYHVEVIRAVHEAVPSVPVIFVSLASPYYLSLIPDADGYVCAYGGQPSSQRAVARVLRGERVAEGRLPVTIPALYPYGAGLVGSVLGAVTSAAAGGAAGAGSGGGAAGASRNVARTPK
jgi:beta-N-acetylhexosaminidase